ncbi:MAG: signal recognition particle-docking protein FtsY [Candidatus Micrarchaeaceae archaeon]
MFDGLRKRLAEAIKSFSSKEEIEEKQSEKKEIEKDVENQQKKQEIKLSFSTKAKKLLLNEVKLSESDINKFADSLVSSMIQADISYEAAEEFVNKLKKELLNTPIDSKNFQVDLSKKVKEALLSMIPKESLNFYGFIEDKIKSENVPVKLFFIGPNGTGKTTTIAKIAYQLSKRGIDSVFSASDTFRAAAIEQAEHHANALHIPIIKSTYGADPASIAYDAIAYAKAHKIKTVLIDSAGRQETNKNLVSELQKMERVIKPDLTIYVGESTSGNTIIEQVSKFSKFIKIDGIILTKLDCDAKGGSAISVAFSTKIPILFFGVGEAYDDIIPYSPNIVINAIIP